MKKYKINKGFIMQKIGNKLTIFDGEESAIYTFNESAGYIFNKLKIGWNEQKIIQSLIKKYQITQQRALKDVKELIKILKKNKIIFINELSQLKAIH